MFIAQFDTSNISDYIRCKNDVFPKLSHYNQEQINFIHDYAQNFADVQAPDFLKQWKALKKSATHNKKYAGTGAFAIKTDSFSTETIQNGITKSRTSIARARKIVAFISKMKPCTECIAGISIVCLAISGIFKPKPEAAPTHTL